MLQGSRREALLAVDLYNRTAAERSLEAFVMHMHVAWLYMLHAKFKRDGPDYRYRQADGRRFVRVDGEVKTWELARCLRQAFPSETNPVRCNVEFFIKARNKIEHRYEELLATVLAGKTQAHVLNYEETLTAWFPGEGLGDSLRFPVFMSSLTPDAVKVLKTTHRQLPKKLTTFIREHDAALPSEVAEDWRYDFRVLLLPQTGPKTESDAVMRFVREDEMTPDVARARDVVQTIMRNKTVAVQNKGRHKPGTVAKVVSEALGVKFTNFGHHVARLALLQAQAGQARRPSGADRRPLLRLGRAARGLPLHGRVGKEADSRVGRPGSVRARHRQAASPDLRRS
jgi:hypothetical protein